MERELWCRISRNFGSCHEVEETKALLTTLPLKTKPSFRPRMAPTLRSRQRSNIAKQKNEEGSSRDEIARLESEIVSLKTELARIQKKKHGDGMQHSNAHAGGEMTGDYSRTSIKMLILKRGGWLCMFLYSLYLTSLVIKSFEETLEHEIQLAKFMPLIIGHGGNAGGQTIGCVLGALTACQIRRDDGLQVVCKEFLAGLGTGTLTVIAISPLLFFGDTSTHVAVVVMATIIFMTTFAALLAAALPFLCLSVGLDPAAIAAPAMTTLVDVGGLLAYFSIARMVFDVFGVSILAT